MAFLVVEESVSVRHLLSYILLSLGIRGIPAESKKQAEAELASRSDIEGAIVDIDNKSTGGIELIKALKNSQKTQDIKIIVHTIQSQKEIVVAMAELGVAGYLLKPFHEAETFKKLKNILTSIDGPKENLRKHIRVLPSPDELLRVYFRVSGYPQLLSGKLINVSMGGLGIELITPVNADVLKPDVLIAGLQFTLLGRELSPSGIIVAGEGKILGIRFQALSSGDSISLAHYIYDKISAEKQY